MKDSTTMSTDYSIDSMPPLEESSTEEPVTIPVPMEMKADAQVRLLAAIPRPEETSLHKLLAAVHLQPPSQDPQQRSLATVSSRPQMTHNGIKNSAKQRKAPQFNSNLPTSNMSTHNYDYSSSEDENMACALNNLRDEAKAIKGEPGYLSFSQNIGLEEMEKLRQKND